MTVLGPNDPRGLRKTGRTWTRDGLSGDVMTDGVLDYECFSGSVADISNGRLDAYLERPGGPVEQLAAEFARQRRYDQCDETCTADCGHCKGQPPSKVQRVQELRRSSAAQPHRNRRKYHRPSAPKRED